MSVDQPNPRLGLSQSVDRSLPRSTGRSIELRLKACARIYARQSHNQICFGSCLGGKIFLVNLDEFRFLDHTCIQSYYHKQAYQSVKKKKNSTTPILKETWT